MDAGADALLLDEALEQGEEALAIGLAESTGEIFFVATGDLATAGEEAAALGGHVKSADAAVAGERPARDEAALLELVDDRDHAAGGGADRLSDRLLGLALGDVDCIQHSEQRGMQVDLCDPLGEALGSEDPHLGEQKREGRRGLIAVERN
jgi:hypothetical protein